MAGSDFSAFLALIGKVVLWVISRTVDLFCLVLLAISCVLPWRLVENFKYLSLGDEWRCLAFGAFMLTLLDFVAVPLTLLSLLSPFRWHRVYHAFKRYEKDRIWELRFELGFGSALVPLDLLSAACFLVQHLFPLRTHLLYRRLAEHWRFRDRDWYAYYGSERSEVALFVVGTTLLALLDTLCCLLGGACTLATPSLWHCTLRGVTGIFYAPSPAVPEPQWTQTRWDTAYGELRLLLLSRVLYLPVDWAATLLGLFALLSPFRHLSFRRAMHQDGGWALCGLGVGQGGHHQSAAEKSVRGGEARGERGVYNDLSYNTELRRHCLYYGSTAVVDVLLFPVMLPLLLTWYRYHPVRADLFNSADMENKNKKKSDEMDKDVLELECPGLGEGGEKPLQQRTLPIKQWGFREYGIIARQFSFLVMDLIIAPLLLVVFLTQYRYAPVQSALAKDNRCSWYSLKVYAQLLVTSSHMFLDLLVLPAWLLLLITRYRAGPALFLWRTKTLWHGTDDAAIWFHVTVLCNFVLVLHDLMLAPLLLLVLFLTGIRANRGLCVIQSALQVHRLATEQEQERHSSGYHQNSAIEELDGSAAVSERLPSPRPAPPPPARVPDVFPSSTWRTELWIEFFNIFFDLPFVVMSIVVYGTLWRARCLYTKMKKVDKEFPEHDLYLVETDSCCGEDDDCCCGSCCHCLCFCCCWFDFYKSYNRRNWYLRGHVLEQFLLLLRDVLVLFPLIIVVGTLYRLPNLILDLIAKCSPMNTTDEPAFCATEVHMLCPEAAGDPIVVCIRCSAPPTAAQRRCDLESNGSGTNEELPPPHYSGPARLFVSGDSFWESVGNAFGNSIMRIGRGMLPKKLVAGEGVGLGVVQVLDGTEPVHKSSDSQSHCDKKAEGSYIQTDMVATDNTDTHRQQRGDATEGGYKIEIKLDVGNTKRTTILKKLKSLNEDVRFILQVEAMPSSPSLSPVVVALTPKVRDLVRIFDQQTSFFPTEACDQNSGLRTTILASDGSSAGLVDELWVVVLLHFAEVLLDVGHLLLSLCTLLLPWRALQLLMVVSETDKRSTWREASELYREYCDAKECLLEYKAGMAPLMNSLSKQHKGTVSSNLRNLNPYYRWYSHYDAPAVTDRLKDLEKRTWREYEGITERILKKAGKCPSASIQALGAALRESKRYEDLRMQHWAHRGVFNTLSEEEERQWRVIAKKPREKGEWEEGEHASITGLLVQVVEATETKATSVQKDKDRLVEHALGVIYEDMLKETRSGSGQGRPLPLCKQWGGLRRRSTGALRLLVQRQFRLVIQDLGYLLTLLVVCLTVVRVLPLVTDLWNYGSCRLTAPGPRRLLLLHLRGAGKDLQRLGKCVGYSCCVMLLGVGVPSFISKLPARMRSLEDATLCAQEHLQDSCRYLGELLLLCTAWRSYKLLVTALLYAILVPPACLAEAIPRALSSVQARFIFGVIVWFGLVIGAVLFTLQTDGTASEQSVRFGFFALFGSLTAVVACAVMSLQTRSLFRNPIVDSSTGFMSLSWSHIVSLLLGPIEALQLSSVVLYFFWNKDGTGGNFTFPVIFLFDTPDSDPAHFLSYSTALTLASCCVYVWVVVVALPLVFDAEQAEERRKMRALQRSPVFDTLHVLLSRVLFVSILATLMRPFSCQYDERSNADTGLLVLSTDHDVLCGGDESLFSGSASSILLAFFVITSTVLHADSPDMMNAPDHVTNGEAHSSVRFAPLFSLVLSLGQLLLCVLLMGLGAGAGGKRGVLVCVVGVSMLLTLWCVCYPWRSCSLPCVAPIRAAGFAVVAFAACLCYVRDTNWLAAADPHWRDQTILFPVAAGLFVVGCFGGWWAQCRAAEEWMVVLQGAGLGDALERVAALGEVLLVQEALGGSKEGARRRAQGLLQKAQECRSAPALGLLLVRFEEQILTERLRFEFLCSRDEWRQLLLGGTDSGTSDREGDSDLGGVSYDQVAQGAQALQNAIKPHAPLAVVNKHLLAMVFINHLPEYVAWEVFRFMYDVTPLVRALEPLLIQDHEQAHKYHLSVWSPTHAVGMLDSARKGEQRLRQELYVTALQKSWNAIKPADSSV